MRISAVIVTSSGLNTKLETLKAGLKWFFFLHLCTNKTTYQVVLFFLH